MGVKYPSTEKNRSWRSDDEPDELVKIRFDGKFYWPGELVSDPDPNMPLLEAIRSRRSARSYSNDPVDEQTFAWLVEHCMNAPTACNEQQWKVLYVDDAETIHDLYERGSASFLANTRQCFLLCYNRQSDNPQWLDHVQSGAAFVATFQLLAHSIGIGSCWVGHLPNKSEIKRIFNIDRRYEPIALVTFGYYRGKVKMLPRKHSPEHVIMKNRFRSGDLHFQTERGTTFRTVARWLYYKIPPALRRRIRARTKSYERKFYYETYD